MSMKIRRFQLLALLLVAGQAGETTAQSITVAQADDIAHRVLTVHEQVREWRRDIHAHPELSGQETRTAQLVAEHLRGLGLTVKTGVGGNGVVGLLTGGLPGKVVALRADMDALPVKELTGLPFASTVKAIQMGQESFVAHACGHDGHTAILMGVAQVLAGMRSQLHGSVKFVFQPAEEGLSARPAPGEKWGARAMIADGVLDNPKVDAMFGLHIVPNFPVGFVAYRTGPMLASADTMSIKVMGRQTHGAYPWAGVDPITVSSQIVLGLQTIVSRQLDISSEPAVVSIGAFRGGNRENIIPDSVELLGTVRTFNEEMREDTKKRIVRTAEGIASASNARVEVSFDSNSNYDAVNNPAALSDRAALALNRVTGGKVIALPKQPFAEDFSLYQKQVPAMFLMLGALPEGASPKNVFPNHSPQFVFNEAALPVGVKVLSALALDFLEQR